MFLMALRTLSTATRRIKRDVQFSMSHRQLFSLLPKHTFCYFTLFTPRCFFLFFFFSIALKFLGLILRYLGNFWNLCAVFCPWASKHVPSISTFNRQGLGGRQILSFPLVPPQTVDSFFQFSSLKANKNTFHTSAGDTA